MKPLSDLSVGDGLLGPAKGLAYRLYEALGIIKRKDVAEEAKALDQDARAALRKMGVRFGAYHIFLPALLKPAPAQLSTMLWALKNDAKDRPGYGDIVAALAAGRTSVIADATFEREFYRLAGFRVLGKRAVRIDILERLADLIRPALAWKPGSGARPAGGYDGDRFVVTPAMMSILGATADDMSEILRGLGYRSDVLSSEFVDAHLAELDAANPAEAKTGDAPEAPQVEVVIKKSFANAAAEAQASAAPSEATEGTDTGAEPASSEGAAAVEAAAEAAPAEPKVTLVWRLVRHDEKRPERSARPVRRGVPSGEAAKAGEGKPRFDRDANRGQKPRIEGRGKPEFARKREEGNAPRPEGKRDNNRKPQHQNKPREERPAKFDPDSPFAKLAALRDQLKK